MDRWLYAGALVTLFSLGVLAANWFILLAVLLAFAGIRVFVIPREEAELVSRFGDAYRDYAKRTGSLGPRFFVGLAGLLLSRGGGT